MNMDATAQYRITGDLDATENTIPTEPGLEDGYIWLMREQHTSLAPGARV